MFSVAIVHLFKGDVKALLDMMQDCNGCDFLSKLKEKWQRVPLDLGFDVI